MLRTFLNHSPQLAATTWIDESAVVIGQVSLGEGVSVWPNATIRGDVNFITIGNKTNVQDGAVIHVTHSGSDYQTDGFPTVIGEGVTIGHSAVIHGCTIGDYSLIGMGAIVLDDTVIQKNVMVAAGALVPSGKVLESGYLYVGSPAKAVRKLTTKELSFLEFSANHYQRLSEKHQTSSTIC